MFSYSYSYTIAAGQQRIPLAVPPVFVETFNVPADADANFVAAEIFVGALMPDFEITTFDTPEDANAEFVSAEVTAEEAQMALIGVFDASGWNDAGQWNDAGEWP